MKKKLTRKEVGKLCFECKLPAELIKTKIMDIAVDAYRCPKCKEVFFSEELARKTAIRLEERRMEEQYKKNPIKIGHSLGLTFPKEIVDVFGLSKKSSLKKNARRNKKRREKAKKKR